MAGERDIHYRAEVRSMGFEDAPALPIYHLMLHEHRAGGWTGVLDLRPRVDTEGEAFDAVIGAGLAPGTACGTTLRMKGGPRARTWTSVITAATAKAPDSSERYAMCALLIADPLTALRNRRVYFGWGECGLDALVGGAMSCAANGAGTPGREPALRGMPPIRVYPEVRSEVRRVPYAIARGETLGEWLDALCEALRIRIEILSTSDGRLAIALRDKPPPQSGLNRGGPIEMTADDTVEPSTDVIVLGRTTLASSAIERGSMIDVPSRGDPVRFGPRGAVGDIFETPLISDDEARERKRRREQRAALAQVRVHGLTGQPGMLPGRTVRLMQRAPDSADAGGSKDAQSDFGSGQSAGTTTGRDGSVPPAQAADLGEEHTLFGTSEWQVCEIPHIYRGGGYVNEVALEKASIAWYPEGPHERRRTHIVTGIIECAEAEAGERVARDRLGRIPVRLAFMRPKPEESENEDWSTTLILAVQTEGGGSTHTVVTDHREGDLCKVRVHGPLSAEIVGFVHRDDRAIKESAIGATAAVLVGQDSGEWEGFAFEPWRHPDDGGETAAQAGESGSGTGTVEGGSEEETAP